MFKNMVLAVCAVVVLGSAGCSLRGRQGYVTPSPKQAAPVDYGRPALMAPAPILPISTNTSAAAARPVAKPAPVLPVPVPAPAATARKDSAATATVSLSTAYHLKGGDPLVIYLRGIPGVPGGQQEIEDIIDENGLINMPYVGSIQAGGKTSTELEQIIQKTYIEQQIYKYITVNVVVPSRSYYVRGEIRQPGRYQLLSRVTVNQAIAAAGGFSEFANPSKVEILRGSQRIRVDAAEFAKHPDRDKELESGDVIIVHRSFF